MLLIDAGRMSKALILAAALAVSGATAVAISNYVSPAAASDTDVPPVRVKVSSANAVAQLEQMSVERFILLQTGRREHIPSFIHLVTARENEGQVQFSVRLGGDLVFVADAYVSPVDAQHSDIDVRVKLTESKFSNHPDLHPYDIKAIEILADQVITEYVNSVLNSQRMASEKELEPELIRRLGFSKEQGRAFGKRIETAFEQSYAADLKRSIENERQRGYFRGAGYDDWRFGEPLEQQDRRYPGRQYVRSVDDSTSAQPTMDAVSAAEHAASAADAAAAAAGAAAASADAGIR